MKLSVYAKDFVGRVQYGSSAPKYAELVFVDPCKIERVLSEDSSISRKDTGRVLGGCWDLNTFLLDDLPKYQICKKHFIDGDSRRDAGAFENMADLFLKHEKPDRCENWDDVHRRYAGLDELYHFFKTGGVFKTRKELLGRRWFREKGGVYVHFDRSGEPGFGGGGCHRLALAKILKLQLIPVQVGVVHLEAVNVWRTNVSPS